jgi:hypothetical protein
VDIREKEAESRTRLRTTPDREAKRRGRRPEKEIL